MLQETGSDSDLSNVAGEVECAAVFTASNPLVF
jgi:hypothetical protein